MSFFGSRSPGAHGSPFDHKVATAYELFPETIGRQLEHVGFRGLEVESNPGAAGGRPFDNTTVLAQKPDGGRVA